MIIHISNYTTLKVSVHSTHSVLCIIHSSQYLYSEGVREGRREGKEEREGDSHNLPPIYMTRPSVINTLPFDETLTFPLSLS